MKAAAETIAAARANVKQAERVLAMTQNNYKYGAATTLDIVDAQTAVSVARTNLLRGLYDYSVARANLRWTAGRSPGSKNDAQTSTALITDPGRGGSAVGRLPEEGNRGQRRPPRRRRSASA